MRLTRLHLRDFKRYAELVVEPAPGLTVIRGPNESGKSTIQQAIELGLFRKADSTAQVVMDARRWGSAAPSSIEIDFEADGVPGRLVKVFAGDRGTVEMHMGDEVLSDPARIQATIADLTGIPDERFFRSTANVRQDELADLGEDDRHLHDRLQVVVSGADRGTTRAKRMLDDAIKRHRSEGPRNPGSLRVTRDQAARLQADLEAGEAGLSRLEADRAAWVEAHERRQLLDGQLTRNEADLEEADRAVGLAARRDDSQARYERLRKAAELAGEVARLQASRLSPYPVAELRTHVRAIETTVLDMSELEADLEVEVDVAEPVVATRSSRPWLWLGLGALLVIVAGIAYLALGGLPGVLAMLVLAASGVVCLIGSIRSAFALRQRSLEDRLAYEAAERRRDSVRERQEQFRRRRRDLEAHLSAIGVESPEAATTLLAAAEAYEAELLSAQGELRGLLGGDAMPADIIAQRDQAANDAEQARHALAAMGEVTADPVSARRRAQSQAAATRSARDEARSAEDRALGRVDTNEVDADSVAGLAEQLDAAQRQLVELERRVRIYQATLEAIVAAEQTTMKTAARYLEARMGPDIERITGGRYSEIAVDERNLAFRVRSAERGDLVGAGSLSRGTTDQLFLAARLGLVSLVTMDRHPPLILDDPFVTFDADRTARALTLLRQVAAHQGFQVIYLTCSAAFDDLADRVIELEAPTVPAPVAVEAGH